MSEEFKKTSSEERKFKGGAQRDAAVGKGAPHWMPSVALFLVSRIYENGNIQRDKLSGGPGNGDTRNWENGMPINELLGSAERHIQRFREGDRSEPHLPMAIWNLLNALMMAVWVYLGFRDAEFNNLPDHIHPWKPGDQPPCPLSQKEIEWLEFRGIKKEAPKACPGCGSNDPQERREIEVGSAKGGYPCFNKWHGEIK